ncbi:zinc finger, RING/FYVE/PHD-type containing protein [Tanacetum coccineum]|uniref:RING-type E3 ubiquitin transferase n=1 Tax=Tanacetum coccineum TaxID=301880 RepID=A0ABQ5CUP4_9ASTR
MALGSKFIGELYCEVSGKTCGFKNDYGETNCIASSSSSSNGGISRGAKYRISLGISIPRLVFLISLANYISKLGSYNQDQRENIELLSIAITRRPPSTTALDKPTIESYPSTVLGENCELPKDHHVTCAICLSDYKPKDAVRTIPECNHYFHADCIDEWLKLNVTCPVCRKSPQSSSFVTSSSSVSSSSLDSTNSSHTTTSGGPT